MEKSLMIFYFVSGVSSVSSGSSVSVRSVRSFNFDQFSTFQNVNLVHKNHLTRTTVNSSIVPLFAFSLFAYAATNLSKIR